MYDASGVRLYAGRQAELLNQIVCEFPPEHPLSTVRPLRELLGHTHIQVELDIDVKAILYDTKQSFYKCNFINGECTFNTTSLAGNYIVLTSPVPKQMSVTLSSSLFLLLLNMKGVMLLSFFQAKVLQQ